MRETGSDGWACADPGHAERPTRPDWRSGEANHRVANTLQLAAIILRRERRGVTDAASARAALDNVGVRLAAMARLHRQISHDAPDRTVSLSDYLAPFARNIEDSLGMAVEIRPTDAQVSAQVVGQIGIVLTELAINATKHAARDGKAAGMTVTARGDGADGLHLEIGDDGPGLPEGFAPDESSGLGMSIVTSAIDRLNGRVRVRPGPGAVFEIDLPPG